MVYSGTWCSHDLPHRNSSSINVCGWHKEELCYALETYDQNLRDTCWSAFNYYIMLTGQRSSGVFHVQKTVKCCMGGGHAKVFNIAYNGHP